MAARVGRLGCGLRVGCRTGWAWWWLSWLAAGGGGGGGVWFERVGWLAERWWTLCVWADDVDDERWLAAASSLKASTSPAFNRPPEAGAADDCRCVGNE